MRATNSIVPLALAILALGACHRGGGAASSQTAIPGAGEAQRAAGLWVEKVADRHGVATTQYCLDQASAGRLSYLGRQLNGKCSRHDMARAADGSWHFATACDMGAWGKVATEGVIKGDFASHYTVEATSQTVDAADSSANGPRRMTADVQRVGDCPKDLAPGEAILPDGRHAKLNDLSA